MGGTVKVPEVLAAQGIEHLFEDEFHGFRLYKYLNEHRELKTAVSSFSELHEIALQNFPGI